MILKFFQLLNAQAIKTRGLEITDVNNAYLKKGMIQYSVIKGYWSDAGTINSLMRAGRLVQEKSTKKHKEY